MNKLKLLLAFSTLFHLFISSVYAQHDSIEVRKNFGTSFWYQGNPLQPKKLQDVVKNNQLACQEMKRARLNSTIFQIIAFQGYSAVLIYPLSTLITGNKLHWEVLAVGGCLILTSIPFNRAYAKHARKAVNIYNSNPTSMAKSNCKLNIRLSAVKATVNFQF